VTLSVHPLFGLPLPVVQYVRDRDGRRYIEAEHPRGWTIRLPVEWTDRGAPLTPPRLNGREVKAYAKDLLRLANAIAARDKNGGRVPPPAGGKDERPHISPQNLAAGVGSAGARVGAVVHPVRDDTAERDRGVGHSRSQSPTRQGTARGGRT
jgi:hypothetical protein